MSLWINTAKAYGVDKIKIVNLEKIELSVDNHPDLDIEVFDNIVDAVRSCGDAKIVFLTGDSSSSLQDIYISEYANGEITRDFDVYYLVGGDYSDVKIGHIEGAGVDVSNMTEAKIDTKTDCPLWSCVALGIALHNHYRRFG